MYSKVDNKAIKQLFGNLADAWNSGDGIRYASYFTNDSDYIAYNGKHLKGRIENAEYHNQLFKGFLKKSKLIGQITDIRFLNNDMAIVIQTGCVQLRFQKQVPKGRLSINTNILVRLPEGWRITAFHNCRIKKNNLSLKLLSIFKTNKQ